MNFNGIHPFGTKVDDDELSNPLNDNSSSSSSSSNQNELPKEKNISFSQPAPTTNKLQKPNEEVIVIDDDDDEPNKPPEDKQDSVSDSDSIQIISLEECRRNVEANRPESKKPMINVLSEKESKEVCINHYKNQMGQDLKKTLNRKKKKILNRNEIYDPVRKGIQKIDSDFDEVINKEFNGTANIPSPFDIDKKKRQEQEMEYRLLQKNKNSILNERAKFLGFNLDEDDNFQNPPNTQPLPPNQTKRFNRPNNQFKTPNQPPKRYIHANTSGNRRKERSITPPKEIKRVDLRDIREKVMKELVDVDQDNAKFLKYFFAESKKYGRAQMRNRMDYELNKIPSGKDIDIDAFYSAGVYLFKNLIFELVEVANANNGMIALSNERDKWRKREYKKYTHKHHHHHHKSDSEMPSLNKKRVNH